ncbi:MAG: T9SS type A sorting domain-containing protein [Chitinophagales bacterium]
MKKDSTNYNSAKKLAGYSVMAGAFLATAGDANALIVYHDEDPDFESTVNELYEIDLDDDGTVDVTLYPFQYVVSGSTTGGLFGTSFVNDVFAIPGSGNYVAGSVGAANYGYPYALDSGSVVDDAQSFLSYSADPRGYGLLSLAYSRNNIIDGVPAQLFYSGNWIGGVDDKFLGVKFDIDGDYHFGWIRMDVGSDNASFTVKDWAYEAVADAGIETGQTTGGVTSIETIGAGQVTAYSYGNTMSIVVNNLDAKNATVQVSNLEGQIVYSGSLNMSGMQIKLDNVASGNYILHVVTNDNATYTKQLSINN